MNRMIATGAVGTDAITEPMLISSAVKFPRRRRLIRSDALLTHSDSLTAPGGRPYGLAKASMGAQA